MDARRAYCSSHFDRSDQVLRQVACVCVCARETQISRCCESDDCEEMNRYISSSLHIFFTFSAFDDDKISMHVSTYRHKIPTGQNMTANNFRCASSTAENSSSVKLILIRQIDSSDTEIDDLCNIPLWLLFKSFRCALVRHLQISQSDVMFCSERSVPTFQPFPWSRSHCVRFAWNGAAFVHSNQLTALIADVSNR